jgi:hypothetical protein
MTDTFVLKHMTLIDGTRRPPLENAVIVIRDKHIDLVECRVIERQLVATL